MIVRSLAIVVALATVASADTPWLDQQPKLATDEVVRPIVGFRVTGPSKLTNKTLENLSRYEVGDPVSLGDVPRIVEALESSTLFETIAVHLELDAAGTGVIVVAELDDKHSWIAIPALFVFTGNKAIGVGYAENDLFGENKKMLLYAQYGSNSKYFFGTILTPRVGGTPLTTRFDLYPLRRTTREFVNPTNDASSTEIARTSTFTFLNAGALVGWNWAWWFNTDARLRGAYAYYQDAHAPDESPLPNPDVDGWDVSLQLRATIDTRSFERGVAWGTYLQLTAESAVPGVSDYRYSDMLFRAYRSFRFWGEHQLEFRGLFNVGYHLPFHDELTAGGTVDLRGYSFDQFRGDRRYVGRAEYSVPLYRYRWLSFRALAFYDTTYMAFRSQRSERDYLDTTGDHYFRNDAGGGIRIYVNNIVLPLLGFDIGYGLENKARAFYLQVGLTDF